MFHIRVHKLLYSLGINLHLSGHYSHHQYHYTFLRVMSHMCYMHFFDLHQYHRHSHCLYNRKFLLLVILPHISTDRRHNTLVRRRTLFHTHIHLHLYLHLRHYLYRENPPLYKENTQLVLFFLYHSIPFGSPLRRPLFDRVGPFQ